MSENSEEVKKEQDNKAKDDAKKKRQVIVDPESAPGVSNHYPSKIGVF